MSEKGACAHDATNISTHEDEQGNDNGEVKVASVAETLEDLDALLKIDEGYIEAEDVAWETGNPFEPVTGVGNSKYNMENERPSAAIRPGREYHL